MQELERRLQARNDSEEIIAGRMKRATSKSVTGPNMIVLINEDMSQCLDDVRAIIAAERLRRERQPYLLGFVRGERPS
jgi:guanylate kinase